MANNELKYLYALDVNEKTISISEALKDGKYHCPYCHQRMIIREGLKKRKHYAHYRNTQNCSYETYLHSLAKKLIENWFNSFAILKMGLKVNRPCIFYNKCKWKDIRSNNECIKKDFMIFNLKSFYNIIEVEKKYNGFIPDLLLTNKDKPNQDPIFIEIYVTHPCSEEKKNSNIRIIEIKLNNEEELEDLIIDNLLKESENIKLYNFNPRPIPIIIENFKRLSKIVVYNDMRIERKNVNCKSFQNREKDSIYEITYSTMWDNPALFGMVKAYEEFPSIKNCILCKNHVNHFYNVYPCLLHKDLKLEDMKSKYRAYKCPSYEIDKEKIKTCLETNSDLPYEIWKNKTS